MADWFSPETWKPVADLVTDWKTIGGAAVLVGGALWRWGTAPFRWAATRFRSDSRGKTRIDLRFVTDDHATFWKFDLYPVFLDVVSLHGRFHVTNVSDANVYLVKFRCRGLDTKDHALRTGHDSDDAANHLIPAGQMSEVLIACGLVRPRGSKLPRKPVVADVIFTNNFGGEHKVRNVRFRVGGLYS